MKRMFLYDRWYVAAFASDVTPGKTVARRICNTAVVFYRTESGRVAALEDRCIHRGVPLSYGGGECEGEIIRCPYHGIEFGPDGACVKVPGDTRIPPGAQLLTFPVVEKDKLIWIWMGEASEADPSLIIDHPHHSDPKWRFGQLMLEMDCDWELVNDNLLDLTHLGLIHRNTIGGNLDQHANAIMKTQKVGDEGVLVTRWLPESDPPPHYTAGGNFAGKIDRWQEIDWTPGIVRLWSGGTNAGTGAYEGVREGGVQIMGLHMITPSTAKSCYYHFTHSYNFKLDDDRLFEVLQASALQTTTEDQIVLAAQQQRLDETPDRPLIDVQADAAGLQGRRIIKRMLAQEAAKRAERARATAAE